MDSIGIARPDASRRWLFGPVVDLAFGCGGLYLLFFVAQTAAGPALRSALPLSLLPFLTLLLGSPHYGATVMRAYSTAAMRRRHAFAAFGATGLIAAAFVTGLHVPLVGSILVTLYLSWSPWHYSGQNYGVAMMLLRRGGVAVDPSTARWLRASFVLSFLVVLLSLNGASGTTQQAAIGDFEGSIYTLLSLSIPLGIRDPLMLGAIIAWLGATATAIVRLGRSGALRAAGPAVMLIGIQALWFLLPASVVVWPALAGLEPFDPAHRGYAFMWVAVGHFLQYLWIATWSGASPTRPASRLRYLAQALLVGVSVWTLPTLVFAPDLLGPLPYDLGLGLLAAAAVNLHHFVLDGVIWRLRDERVARSLLGPHASASEAALVRDPRAPATPRRSKSQRAAPAETSDRRLPAWIRGTGQLAATGVLALSLAASWESLAGNHAAQSGDVERYGLAARRRAWLGRDGPGPRLQLGVRALQAGDLERAQREAERGLDLYPSADLWRLAGEVADRRGEPDRALAAFEQALALDAESAPAHYQLGRLLADRGRLEEALAHVERAEAIWPDTSPIRELLAALRAQRARRAPTSSEGSR